MAQGLNVSVGKFLPAIGYLNEKHRHTWDFSNTSLINQAFWGEEAYRDEGVQLNYVLPFENYFEVGAMKGRGENFPGTSRTNGLNSNLLFAKFGQDVGFSSSYKFGLSWFSNKVMKEIMRTMLKEKSLVKRQKLKLKITSKILTVKLLVLILYTSG